MMTSLLVRLALLFTALYGVNAITQTRTLMWTEKETSDGVVNIKGIPGDPREWIRSGIRQYSMSYFTDDYSRNTSHRVALGFRYAYSDLSFSDRGFKNIYRIELRKAPYVPWKYWLPLHTVYTGISTQVNGMAVDWLSASIYWTDALYNWITVARLRSQDIFNHIVTTQLDRPMGLAVYPQNGSLYWSDLGAVPKIERSRLDGTGREIFVSKDLDKPLGLSVDYAARRLYWVDDFRDTIESVDLLTAENRRVIRVYSSLARAGPQLFALTVFDDFIFASEQIGMTIMIFNKTSTAFIKHINAAIFDNATAIPYDVTMYDLSLQESVNSDCRRLNCMDICISDGGRRAHCICRMGYQLTDHRRCGRISVVERPMYIYSIGPRLCGTHVRITDYTRQMAPVLVKCFHSLPGRRFSSLAFHIYADLLFFSEANDHIIHRMRMETAGEHVQAIAANTGKIGGLAVDWIADNLYWAEEDRGNIVMSRLDGRYRTVLISGLTRPKSINVNPLTGLMYWVSDDMIYVAKLDGTDSRVFLRLANSRFDGMVIDVRRDRIYWVDSALPGIRCVRQNGTDHKVMMQAAASETFNDVTVYQNLFAWTNGQKSIYFGRKDGLDEHIVELFRGIRHFNDSTSHDIITYDDYLQPPLDANSSLIDLCDLDNDQVGCHHLCVLVDGGHKQCACSVGFHLAADQHKCISDRLKDNFLLFVDPQMKTMFQVDLMLTDSGAQKIHGIDIRTSNVPARVAYDLTSHDVYWHDNEFDGLNSVKRMSLAADSSEHSLTILADGHDVGNVEAIPTMSRVVFSEMKTRTLQMIDSASPSIPTQLRAAADVVPSALAVDRITGELYWVERTRYYYVISQSIYSCNPESCSSRDKAAYIISWTNSSIIGLHVAIDCDWNITFWSSTAIYGVKMTGDSSTIELLFDGKHSFNITNAVTVDNLVFFTDWRSNSVLMTSRGKQVFALTDPVFSRLTDLKAYRSPDWVPPAPQVAESNSEPGLSAGALGGLIGAGIAILALLLLFLAILLVVLTRRRRLAKATYKSAAHDNPTYMTHRDVLAAAGSSPVDLVFDASGDIGVAFYADDEKKKIPLDDDAVVAAAASDADYWQYDEKPSKDDYENMETKPDDKDTLPGIEPPPPAKTQYANLPYSHHM